MKILVTGATGFVGGAVIRRLAADGIQAVAAVRRPAPDLAPFASCMEIGDIGPHTDWARALDGVTMVIHAAARVHIMQDAAADPLVEFRRVNVEGTLRLAQQAASAGVQRFVFVSSIKVNGEASAPGKPFHADQPPQPCDPYGISKMEAEEGLRILARGSAMEVTIVRPPLVYGPGVRANFGLLMRLLRTGIPLPLGTIDNRRSFVGLDNLTDLLITCVTHPAAANRTFLVSDGEDLSTPELLRRLGRAMGKPARLIPMPSGLLHVGAAMLGRREIAQRLCGWLQADIGETRRLLGWAPPVSVDEGLCRAVGRQM